MFNSKLVNDPFGDPALYVKFMHRNEAVLFDLGDIQMLSPREILKLSHIFITHTHMDHFIGFDRLLRICLGRDQHICLYGPPGFIQNVESKIRGYSWNLVENYTNDFTIRVTEIHQHGQCEVRQYRCRTGFLPEYTTEICASSKVNENMRGSMITIFENALFSVSCLFLDHKIPCLAYHLEEKQHVNIMKNNLQTMGLPTGPWLTELKNMILDNEPDETPIQVWWRESGRRIEADLIPLKLIKDRAIKITPGERIAYISDAIYNPDNIDCILKIAHNADHLYIEACFPDKDSLRAKEKYHLTAAQAGLLGKKAGAKRITLFHFSPKYHGQEELLIREAMEAFED